MKKIHVLSLTLLALVGIVAQSSYAGTLHNKAKSTIWVATSDEKMLPEVVDFIKLEKKGGLDFGEAEYLFIYPQGAKKAVRYHLPVNADVRFMKDLFGTHKFGYLNKEHNKRLGKGEYKSKSMDAKKLREYVKSEKAKMAKLQGPMALPAPKDSMPKKTVTAYEILNVKKDTELNEPWMILKIKASASDADIEMAATKMKNNIRANAEEFKKLGATDKNIEDAISLINVASINMTALGNKDKFADML